MLLSAARGWEIGTSGPFCGLATKTGTYSARMECCGNIVSGNGRAPLLHFGKELVVHCRPVVESGMPEKSGFGALLPRCAVEPLRRSCISAEMNDGFRARNCSGCAGARFPTLLKSFRKQKTSRGFLIAAMAEEEDGNHVIEEEETPEVEVANLGPPVTVRNPLTSVDFWLQVAIFVFTAGFLDAGFSGDWSRIGVLSKEIEGDLKMAALGVIPLAVTLIWSISERRKQL